jgi:hypothetical protein
VEVVEAEVEAGLTHLTLGPQVEVEEAEEDFLGLI